MSVLLCFPRPSTEPSSSLLSRRVKKLFKATESFPLITKQWPLPVATLSPSVANLYMGQQQNMVVEEKEPSSGMNRLVRFVVIHAAFFGLGALFRVLRKS